MASDSTGSCYRRLRLSGEWAVTQLDALGFVAANQTNERGALTIVATRDP